MTQTIAYPNGNKSTVASSIHTRESLLKKVEYDYETDATKLNTRHTLVCVGLLALTFFGSIQPFLKYYFPHTIFVLFVFSLGFVLAISLFPKLLKIK